MTTVAMFTTYAPSEGFGGPARAFHQRVALESSGHRVVHVVIQSSSGPRSTRRQDIAELVERPFRGSIDHIYNDVDTGNRASTDHRLIQRVIDHLRSEGTTAIILEQPFLVGVVEQVARRLDVPVVYSCQNIEFRLRRDLERFQPDAKRRANRASEVRALEERAVSLAQVITTICPSDQLALWTEFGRDSVIVPNGSSIGTHVSTRSTFDAIATSDFVFAGSSYWPNIEGFAQIATPSLAFLPPTARIEVIGSVGSPLLGHPTIARHHSVNASRMNIRGFVAMDELAATMRTARCIVVPVFIGEGSNLKSADALASGRPVIMTERATHGYEDVINADPEGVTIVPDSRSFRAAMRGVFASARPVDTVGGVRSKMLSWKERLQPLAQVIGELNPAQ